MSSSDTFIDSVLSTPVDLRSSDDFIDSVLSITLDLPSSDDFIPSVVVAANKIHLPTSNPLPELPSPRVDPTPQLDAPTFDCPICLTAHSVDEGLVVPGCQHRLCNPSKDRTRAGATGGGCGAGRKREPTAPMVKRRDARKLRGTGIEMQDASGVDGRTWSTDDGCGYVEVWCSEERVVRGEEVASEHEKLKREERISPAKHRLVVTKSTLEVFARTCANGGAVVCVQYDELLLVDDDESGLAEISQMRDLGDRHRPEKQTCL
ncbi:hypothetical protein BDK51DRAFT_43868 [Blyttiomyces helicus]|uniref:Uncharacterized protein n=1 Tax=Blyttiomyces helicus TaxID=388810 RepID=A0A4P9VUT4_9FUNG|nr:hypothetical protein BDK51DRAFT_43868 [Blyttiomyces helicus]|eukprot:RKO83361.1 hypothetical protein BDK51DRAFT_43868 [Blyttiomyces helicus]